MKAIIDRTEGHVAVLYLTDNPGVVFTLPISVIPDCMAGDIITITISRDKGMDSGKKDRPSYPE